MLAGQLKGWLNRKGLVLFLVGGLSLFLGLLGLGVASDQPAFAADEKVPPASDSDDEWIMKWKEGSQPPSSPEEFTVLSVDWEHQLMLVKLKPHVDVDEWYARWIEKEEIEYIEPDHTLTISFRPNDPGLSYQQHLAVINAFEGWQVERENRDMIIAILDTGVDLSHPDLKDNLVPGINLIDRSKPPQDDNGHGTQVAGVLGAKGNNKLGVAGVLWSSKIMPVKVLDKEGEGTPFRVAQGIYQSIEQGASIVLLSLGDPIFSQTLLDAVEKAEREGVLVIAAVGNEGDRVNYPAAFPTVLAVGAVDSRKRAVPYSNAGPEVGVVASGEVYTTRLQGGYGPHSGTSMAAPQVAGLAALIWKQYPHLLPSEVRNHIMYTSKDVHEAGWDRKTGHGLIDVGKALTTRPVADIYEPNDLMSQAKPFPVDSLVRAELRNKEDVDWFVIEAPYRGTLDVTVTLDVAKTDGVDLIFYPGGEGAQSYLYNITKERKLKLSVPQGKSYLRLKYNAHEKQATPLKYTLKQEFTIYADDQQPNHSKNRATRLQGRGEVLTGTFHRSYLNHWYYFDVPSPGEISLHITVDTLRLDPVIYFERPNGQSSTIDEGSVSNGQLEHLVTRVDPGRHYFRISHYYGHKVNGEYFLRFEYRPFFEDKYEPNNSMNQAVRVKTGESIAATINPRSDVDWYQVTVGRDRYLQVQLNHLPEQVGLEARLYNQQGELLGSYRQKGRERSFAFGDKVDPGTYYVSIRADRAFPFDGYTLKLSDPELLFGFRDISGHWAVYSIVEATRKGLVQGVGDYRFAPDEGMSRAAVATLINRLYAWPTSGVKQPFKDVAGSHWAAQAIHNAVQQGILKGFPDGTFQPERSITRAEVAVLIDRLIQEGYVGDGQAGQGLGKNAGQAGRQYSDLARNHWAYPAIMRLSARGILTGYEDGSFRPQRPMTRAEFVTIIQRLHG